VTALIAGFGAAVPGAAMDQQALWGGFFGRHFAGSRGRTAERIFTGSGVRCRHAVVNPLAEDVSGWSTERRMRRYALEAQPLGHRAVAAALADAGLAADEVKLLIVASCTGYATPGLDIGLAASLGLACDAQRLLVGHMGCYAALPALGSAADFVVARGQPVVLLCLELTSLHVQPPTDDLQQVVAHALFGDAAAALVLVPTAGPRKTSTRIRNDTWKAAKRRYGCESTWDRPGLSGLRLVDLIALTDTSAAEQLTWDVTDLGFRMGVARTVPAALATHVRPAVERLLGRNGLAVPDIRGWAVHPGGPAILETVQRELALPPAALGASRAVLSRHGNCSSPTVLLVLDELVNSDAMDGGGPVVAMAFGPGLTLYAALLSA